MIAHNPDKAALCLLRIEGAFLQGLDLETQNPFPELDAFRTLFSHGRPATLAEQRGHFCSLKGNRRAKKELLHNRGSDRQFARRSPIGRSLDVEPSDNKQSAALTRSADNLQVEGAFVQGMGFFTTEETVVNSDGILQSDGTWTYKIPSADSIPRDFRVELLQNALNKKGILSSKGELTFQVNLSSRLFVLLCLLSHNSSDLAVLNMLETD